MIVNKKKMIIVKNKMVIVKKEKENNHVKSKVYW